VLGALDLGSAKTAPVNFETSVVVNRVGTLHGLGGWFSAQLSPNVLMSNSPLAESPINRRNVFFPFERPVKVAQGDLVKIAMLINPTETMVSWKAEVLDRGGAKQASFNHSTFRGMLITREDLQRNQPQFVPKLTPWGEARRSVVNLCDGARALSEIEEEIFRRHADLFVSRGQAAGFVAEVVTRYSL
jgi:hypothetical protein